MAVKKKESTASGAGIIEAACSAHRELLEKHIHEIMDLVEESEDKKTNVAFGHALDLSETQPSVKTTIRFTQSFTDSRTNQMEDPNQANFFPVVDGAAGANGEESGTPKPRGRPRKQKEEAAETTEESAAE